MKKRKSKIFNAMVYTHLSLHFRNNLRRKIVICKYICRDDYLFIISTKGRTNHLFVTLTNEKKFSNVTDINYWHQRFI